MDFGHTHMKSTLFQTSSTAMQPRLQWPSLALALGQAPLALIVALAAVLRFANLAALGYANHYYTAGVEAM